MDKLEVKHIGFYMFYIQARGIAIMPNAEANKTNCDSNMERNVWAVDKILEKQYKQTDNTNEEFASEIHLDANLESAESKNTFGEETEKRNQQPMSERTAWH